MYIRKVSHRKQGKKYYEYRLVESYRTANGKVRQQMLLNFGANFNLEQGKWKILAQRIEEILHGQETLFQPEERIEVMAQNYACRITKKQEVLKRADDKKTQNTEVAFEMIDIHNIQQQWVRTIGGEHISYSMFKELSIDKELTRLKFNKAQIDIAIGTIVGRILNSGSELSTHDWLRNKSGLDELIGCDFNELSESRVYRISDKLLNHKEELEEYLYKKEKSLFELSDVITLYDLTNTYFEGSGKYNDKAKYGRSKEKRNDCLLVTLGLVLDGDGFPKKSKLFAGNASEPLTLKEMLSELANKQSENKATVVMDAGIASEDNIQYLKGQGYSYIVVSREKSCMPAEGEEIIVKENTRDNSNDEVKVKLVQSSEENKLYCYSQAKKCKEESIKNKFQERYENELVKLRAGLFKKNGIKIHEKVLEKLGRLKEKFKRIARYYKIDLKTETIDDSKKVIAINWQYNGDDKKSGVYCLRTDCKNLDEKTIWGIYTMLTDIEAAFRCMKSELGMRPVYHQKTHRVDGHIFITLLAYHIVHSIRYRLKQKGINYSWDTIRAELSNQIRITSTMKNQNADTIHIRKSTVPTQFHRDIYDALSLSYYPGPITKSVIKANKK
jgi:transposase